MHLHRVAVAVLVSAALLAGAGCSSGKKPGGTLGGAPAAQDPGSIAFSISALNVEAGKPPSPQAVETARSEVLAALNRYLEAAVLTPLRTGGAAGDLGPLVTPAVYGRLAGPDKAALVDEGVGRVDELRAAAASAVLTVLAGQGGEILKASAGIDLELHGRASGTPITIDRTGELVLVVENGAWRIDGYHVQVARDTSAGTTTSKARR